MPIADPPPSMPDPAPPLPRPHSRDADVGIARPGDTIVVAIDAGHSEHAKQGIKERLEADLPPGIKVVLVAARAFIICRP